MTLKQYWGNLQPRERQILLGGGIALALIFVYALIIAPFSAELDRLEESVSSQKQSIAWMRQAAVEIKALQGSQQGRQQVSGQSLMSVIDASARSTGLAEAIKQLSPDGEGVKVRLEAAAFDDMLRWLSELSTKHGISVNGLIMERLPEVGRVNASVVLGGVE